MNPKNENWKRFLFIFFIALLSLPVILPLFNNGFFQTDDGEWMIIRFSAFFQMLSDGQFPVRFLSRLNHEYGYPVANFLYPGFMYAGVPIHMLGFGFVDTIKIIFGASMFFSGIFCFMWLSKITTNISAFFGSLIYLYAPYHLYDLYKRGSVGEILALAVVPFILWQIERRSIFWTSLGTGFLILSHNTLALLFLPMLIVYMVLRPTFRSFHIFVILFLALAISAFFWIPAIYDLQYTVFSKSNVSDFSQYFVDLSLLGFSTIVVFSLTFLSFLRKKISGYQKELVILFLSLGIITAFLATPLSKPLWQFLPVSIIQFPFRVLSITILCAAYLTSFLLFTTTKKTAQLATGMIFLALVFFSSQPYISPSKYFDKGEGFYATNMDTTTVKNEYMPKWVKKIPQEKSEELVTFAKGSGKIEYDIVSANDIRFRVVSDTESVLRINKIFFPGWNIYMDGQKQVVSHDNTYGVMDVNLPRGEYVFMASFGETPIRLLADGISILGILILVFMAMKNKGATWD